MSSQMIWLEILNKLAKIGPLKKNVYFVKHDDKQTNRQTDRHRQTDRRTDGQTNYIGQLDIEI